MAAVLITLVNGVVDYVATGEVDVVYVNLDRHDLDTAFPDDLNEDLAALRALPAEIKWTSEIVGKLKARQREIIDYIRKEGTPHE